MTPHCHVIKDNILAAEAMKIMQQKTINALLIVDEQQRLSGALNMHDLIRAGIV
jgi:arabinose-5-phosphate isomerase